MPATPATLTTLTPTQALAHFVVTHREVDLPGAVRHEATRSLFNWVGCAVGGSRHDTVERALSALGPFSGPRVATVLGRVDRLDVMLAALMNGITSHTFDFDETHLRTVIHPSGPVASAILALAETQPVTGSQFLHAFVLGVEVSCRIGNAVYPSHYDVGWHITGTTGVFGAAAAAGRLLGLDEQQMIWALGIAATQASGLREMFGTMCKPFHPGNAARNGLLSALMARSNFTSSNQAIEAPRGFANVLATSRRYEEITENLGGSWEILANTYKPFACGIVIHPTIDGCIEMRNEAGLQARSIAGVELEVHPLVLELTGKKAPRTGLEGKFSVYHSAAVAIIDGAAGEQQYSDDRVRDPEVVSLRDAVRATARPGLHEDQARITIRLHDGRVLEKFVEHAVGSQARPMSDAALEAKFRGLVEGILSKRETERLIQLCWNIGALPALADVARAAVPAAPVGV
jgi:2-methylcitrate dehydratase PrpD